MLDLNDSNTCGRAAAPALGAGLMRCCVVNPDGWGGGKQTARPEARCRVDAAAYLLLLLLLLDLLVVLVDG